MSIPVIIAGSTGSRPIPRKTTVNGYIRGYPSKMSATVGSVDSIDEVS